MAEITNPQVITFTNDRARIIADSLVRFSDEVNAWLEDYAAQGIAAAINGDAAGASSNIDDGSATDGRQRVTGTKVINLRAGLLQVQTALTTTLVSGVGTTARAISDGIQVNGSVR